MTGNDLLFSLANFFDDVLDGYLVYDKDSKAHEVNVFCGSLPKKMRDTKDKTYFPAVYPILLSGVDNVEGSSVNVRVVIAIHEDGVCDGYLELYNLMEKVRQSLLKSTVIGERYTIRMPLNWENSIDSQWPIWQGWVNFTVDVNQERASLKDWFEDKKQGASWVNG